MIGRSADPTTERQLLLRGWRQITVLQVLVALATLPMLRVQPALTLLATAFNLAAILNTRRIHRARAAQMGVQPSRTGRDLRSVATCVAVSALWALALALWSR